MTAIAPALQAFFTDRLITQRNSSPRTIAAYRDTFKLLLRFAHEQTGKQPFELDIDDLNAPLIGAFLTHLERDRGNTARTRNARLGAIHSFYRFAALEHPEHAHTIMRVMAIPTKRHERNTVSYLDLKEIKALLAAPDRSTRLGRRDRALLALMIQTGVRVSELVGLRVCDVHLGTGHHIRVLGKGRKKRATPLTSETVAVLRQWLTERGGAPEDPSRRMYSATRPRCSYEPRTSTSPPSRCGSATRAPRPPTSTSTPTPRSRRKQSPEPRRSESSPVDTEPPTRSSPSWTRSDYVERATTDVTSYAKIQASCRRPST
jgi:site-specific recombinase XerD